MCIYNNYYRDRSERQCTPTDNIVLKMYAKDHKFMQRLVYYITIDIVHLIVVSNNKIVSFMLQKKNLMLHCVSIFFSTVKNITVMPLSPCR